MLAIVDNFLWSLRREGFAVSTAQAIDAARAAAEIGFDDRLALRDAIACVVADSKEHRRRFDALFAEFFSLRSARTAELDDRLLAQGFSRDEVNALGNLLREFMSPEKGGRLQALLSGSAELDALLAGSSIRDLFDCLQSRDQKGFYAHRIVDELGLARARSALLVLVDGLADAMGAERAEALVQALLRELDRSERRVRDQIERHLEEVTERARAPGDATARPFADLSEAEIDEVRRAVRRLAERLRGAARVRERHRRRGRLDPARTVRNSLKTGGVPFDPVRRDQSRERPKLVVMCDVSDSVRPAARFMLEFVYAVKELFDGTRSFVFVSAVGEVTRSFDENEVATAIARATDAVSTVENTHYGRAFRELEVRYPGALDRRTTLVILGDGRTNFEPSGVESLARIRERCRSVIWLCPEPRATWGTGDNAMNEYAKHVTRALEVASARQLEEAARELVLAR
jgi:uncharacterized protein with von Willebrand factor type A (vWA) domain